MTARLPSSRIGSGTLSICTKKGTHERVRKKCGVVAGKRTNCKSDRDSRHVTDRLKGDEGTRPRRGTPPSAPQPGARSSGDRSRESRSPLGLRGSAIVCVPAHPSVFPALELEERARVYVCHVVQPRGVFSSFDPPNVDFLSGKIELTWQTTQDETIHILH